MKSNDIITIVILVYVVLLLGIYVYSNFKYQVEECQKKYQNCTVLSDYYINYIVCDKDVINCSTCVFNQNNLSCINQYIKELLDYSHITISDINIKYRNLVTVSLISLLVLAILFFFIPNREVKEKGR